MKKNYIFISIIGIIISAFLNINNIFAAEGIITGDNTGILTDPIENKTFIELVQRIIGYLIMIGAPILVLMVLYGAFLILTAREDPKKVEDGKHAILWASIGYAIIICSWGIIYIIQDVLGTSNLIK